MEELRQREANMTALQAIGPRKKIKLEGADGQGSLVSFFIFTACVCTMSFFRRVVFIAS